MKPPIISHMGKTLLTFLFIAVQAIANGSATDSILIADQLNFLTIKEKENLEKSLLSFYREKGIKIRILTCPVGVIKSVTESLNARNSADLTIGISGNKVFHFFPSGRYSGRFGENVPEKINKEIIVPLIEKKQFYSAVEQTALISMSVLSGEPEQITRKKGLFEAFSGSMNLYAGVLFALVAGALTGLWLALARPYTVYDSSGPKTRYSSRSWPSSRSGRIKDDWRRSGTAGQWYS